MIVSTSNPRHLRDGGTQQRSRRAVCQYATCFRTMKGLQWGNADLWHGLHIVQILVKYNGNMRKKPSLFLRRHNLALV